MYDNTKFFKTQNCGKESILKRVNQKGRLMKGKILNQLSKIDIE